MKPNKLKSLISNSNGFTGKTVHKGQTIINKLSNRELLSFMIDNNITLKEIYIFINLTK